MSIQLDERGIEIDGWGHRAISTFFLSSRDGENANGRCSAYNFVRQRERGSLPNPSCK